MSKPMLALAFDGVVATDVELQDGVLSAELVPGARAFIGRAVLIYEVFVQSPLARTDVGEMALREWLEQNLGEHVHEIVGISAVIPAAVTLDTRTVVFKGKFPEPLRLLEVAPWHERAG